MSTQRRLILMRHAKSAWPAGTSDAERPLNARGRAAAPRVGAYLAAEELAPDHVLVSPARRTQETWQAMRSHLAGVEAETAAKLYDASAARILDIVRAAPGSATCLLVIAHNPGLHELAQFLIGRGARASVEALQIKFPTAALAVFDLALAAWSDLGARSGRLERFVTPRGLEDEADR